MPASVPAPHPSRWRRPPRRPSGYGGGACSRRSGLSRRQRYPVAVWRSRSRNVAGEPAGSPRRALMIGAGLVATHIARRLRDHPEHGLEVCGFLDDDPPRDVRAARWRPPILGAPHALPRVAIETRARHVLIAFCADRPDARRGRALLASARSRAVDRSQVVRRRRRARPGRARQRPSAAPPESRSILTDGGSP
jgi:hypothetical protein